MSKIQNKVFLKFSNDNQMKEVDDRVRQFWKNVDRKRRDSLTDKSKDVTEKRYFTQDEQSQAFSESWIRPAEQLLELMKDLGLDQAALAIRSEYRPWPRVCSCLEQDCPCPVVSPYLDRLDVAGELRRLRAQGKHYSSQDLPEIFL